MHEASSSTKRSEHTEWQQRRRTVGPRTAIDRILPAGYDVALPIAPTGAAAKEGTPVHIEPEVAAKLQAGQEALEAGDAEAAREEFHAAVSADPQNLHIPVHAAVAALRENHPEVAVEILQPAVERFPESPAVYRTLGSAYYRLADYASAQVALRQALSLDNSSGLSYLLMGCTLEKLGQPSAAAIHFEQAAALHPNLQTVQR